jgi:2-oxoacid:acceptor oxidoreductase delta subunit (pyruvate/2-ketoisovalerate family)
MVKYKCKFEGPWASSKPNLFSYPTSEWRSSRPIVNPAKCAHCGVCYFQCPVGSIVDKGTYCEADLSYCKGCGVCACECPSDAILMVREEGE